MPEGHTIHRLARLHRRRFAGQRLRVTSPQGRFAAGAAVLDGGRLAAVEGVGKHLFYRWEDAPTLHIHLGLFGKFRTHDNGNAPPPSEATRLAWTGSGGTLYLSGPTVCELVDPDDERSIRERLGPDPLRRGASPDGFLAALGRRTVPIGAALLDQKAIAGIGNVYRSEILFLAGVDPHTEARALDGAAARRLWDLARAQLRAGERAGRIVTVDPADVGARARRDVPRAERLYVYKRRGLPCRRCGTGIERTEMAGRLIWWCPACQPGERTGRRVG